MRASVPPVVASLLILLVPGPQARAGAAAGPAAAPAQQTFASANGRFTAVVESATDDKPAMLRVFEASSRGAAPKWEAMLGCPVAPMKVLVSDDGLHAVTFDDWLRPGYGDDVVAVYLAGRRVVRWSLEQVLIPADLKAVPKSEAGRPWRRNAIELLVDFNSRRYLCVWLGLVGHWQVWDLTAARAVVAPMPVLAAKYNAAAREWSLPQFERPGGDRITAIKFLGSLRDPSDRALLERQLSVEDDYGSAMYFFRYNLQRCNGRSETRKAADAALAAWDGIKPAPVVPGSVAMGKAKSESGLGCVQRELRQKVADHYHLNAHGADANAAPLRAVNQMVAAEQAMIAQFLEQRDDERYACLGVVDVTVRLPQRPDRGSLWVYLVPETVAAADWASASLAHRLCATFGDKPAAGYPLLIPVRFEGVTPGRYWVKAVYDRAEPFCRDPGVPCIPSAGDFESTQRTVFEASADKVTTLNAFDCTAPSCTR